MDKLFVLGAGILQIPIIKKARELGVYTVVADGNEHALGLALTDKAIVANIVDKQLMLEVAKNEGITGVIHPCSEVAMDVMGYINDTLGLSGISEQMARLATNKALMRKAFATYGASSPKSIETTTAEEAWELFTGFTNAGILKPSRNSGSRGIAKITQATSCEEFYEAYEISLSQSRDHSVLLEDFIEGLEFSIEALAYNGKITILTITDKKTTDAPHFVELGHSQPTQLSEELQVLVHQTVIDGVCALELNNCAVHAEVKIQKGKVYIMEIGARLGGDFITTNLVPLSTGIDMVAAAIMISLGKEPDLTPKHKVQGSCVRYVTPMPGVVTEIKMPEAMPECVTECEVYKQVGDEVFEICSSLDRSGHVIVYGVDAKDAVARAEEMLTKILVNTK